MHDAPLEPARHLAALGLVAARELAATLRSGVHPLLRPRRLPDALPREGQPPVLLVHGYMGHAGMLQPLARALRAAGTGETHALDYPSMRWSLERIVDHLAERALAMERDHSGPIDLVGHSLGAVACRAWLKAFGGASHVRRFVSLGGPHAGTSLYRLVAGPLRPVFDPDGPWVRRLAEGPEPVPTTVVRARYDHQVFPPTRAAIPGVAEVVVSGHGHNGLLWAPEAHAAVAHALTTP